MKTIDILSIIANDEENNSKFIKEVYDFESLRKIFGVENLKEFLNKEVAEIEIVENKKIEEIKIDFDEFYKHYIVTTTINEKKYNSTTRSATDKIFCGKINEIIDYINEEYK